MHGRRRTNVLEVVEQGIINNAGDGLIGIIAACREVMKMCGGAGADTSVLSSNDSHVTETPAVYWLSKICDDQIIHDEYNDLMQVFNQLAHENRVQ